MYHPDTMMYMAHKREAELVREADLCGVPQAEADSRRLPWHLLATALVCALPFVLAVVWAVAHA